MERLKHLIILWTLIFLHPCLIAQDNSNKDKKFLVALNEDGSHWLKFHTYLQIWGRVTQNNPGTTVFDELEETTTDISIRRFRVGMQAQLTQKLYAYTQLGINNLNYLSPRGTSVDLLDAYAEYKVVDPFTIGGGKTAWSGLSRYSAPNTSKLLTYDLPFIALPTAGELDDLIRKLSLFAKGKVGHLDYRLVGSKPFSVQNSPEFDPTVEEGISKFASTPADQQYAGYVKWEFWDKESNKIPFSNGTYLGEKSVLNLGAGFEFQAEALWQLQNGDTVFNDMVLWAIDLFLDRLLNVEKGTALTFYGAYFNYDFGPNFVRNIGVNNSANGVDPNQASFNGPGNAFPIIGTGNTLFAQVGYLFPAFRGSGNKGRLQPYFSLQYSDFERLEDPMVAYDLGLNWFLNGHLSKFSLNLQNRPVYFDSGNGITIEERDIMLVLQYLIRIE